MPAQTYIVKSGDTVPKIATQFGVTVNQLVAWNTNIPDENTVYLDTRIYVSDPNATEEETTNNMTPVPEEEYTDMTYVPDDSSVYVAESTGMSIVDPMISFDDITFNGGDNDCLGPVLNCNNNAPGPVEEEMCKFVHVIDNINKYKQQNISGSKTLEPLKIIAGQSSGKKEIKLMLLDLDISKCFPNTHPNNIWEMEEVLEDVVTAYTNTELGLDIIYDYPDFSTKDESWGQALGDIAQNIFIPIGFFLPKRNALIQKHKIKASTCLTKATIPVWIYPDIHWTIAFFWNTKNPVIYRDTWANMTQYRVDDAVNKAQAGDLDGYDGSLMIKFGFKLTAKWNKKSNEASLGEDWAKKMRKYLFYFLKLKRAINKLVHKEQLSETNLGANIMARLAKKPITLEVLSPGISFDFGWNLEAESVAATQEIGILFSGKLKFDPLVGGKGRLDLFAVSQKVPAIGQVITLLDLTLSVLNVDPVFDLILHGKIGVEIEGTINTLGGSKKLQGGITGKFGVEIVLSVKASGKVKSIKWKAEASAKAESYFHPKAFLGTDDEGGLYIDAKVDFTGIKATFTLKAEAGFVGRSKKVDKTIVEKKDNIIGGKYYFNKD